MAKAPTDIRSLARAHTTTAINVLAGIMKQKAAPPAARVNAACALLDRAWGKPDAKVEMTDRTTRDVFLAILDRMPLGPKPEPMLIEQSQEPAE